VRRNISAARRSPVYKLRPGDSELISNLVVLLKVARPTAFALEGILTAVIRSDRCASGWKFAHADLAARELVRRALNQVGARRPTVDEGQRWFTKIGSQCLNCGADLDETGSRYFCDDHCATVARGRLDRRERQWEATWTHEVSKALAAKLRAPMAKCANPTCSNTVPQNPKNDSRARAGTFCSRECASAGRIDRVPERICANPACGNPFRPHGRNSEQRWCSRECAAATKEKPREEMVCALAGCDTRFFRTHANPNQIYCSRAHWRESKRSRVAVQA